jgi:putative spermidine/putrescine transport system substrate-binding protein
LAGGRKIAGRWTPEQMSTPTEFPNGGLLTIKLRPTEERKMKLKSAILLTMGAVLTAPMAYADTDMADSMTMVSWGGAYQLSQVRAYVEPYQAMNEGFEVLTDESSGEAVARLRAMNEAGNVTWDLVDVVAADAMRLCDEGLAMEIDHDEVLAPAPDGTPASEDFGDLIVSDCFIPQIVYSTTFGYRTDVAAWNGATPDDICDVFDLEAFPGQRSLERQPIGNLEWALMCDGVAVEDIYDTLETDEGVAQAFAMLDTIADSTIWWSAGADTPQLLADGEVVFGSTYNGRLFSLIVEQDQPVEMMWDAQVYDLDGWIIPEGLPADRLARVLDFVRFATDTQRLADQSQYISYGPARASSAPLVGQHADLGIEMAPHMPTDPANAQNTFLFNYVWWADYRDDMDARFQAWLSR